MKQELASLQNNPLLLSKAVEGTPALTLIQKRTLLFIYAKVLGRLNADGIDWATIEEEKVSVGSLWYELSADEMIHELRVGWGGNQTVQLWDQLQTLHHTKVILNYKDKDGMAWKRHTHLVDAVDTPVVASGRFKVKLDFQIIKNIQYQSGVIYRFINLKYALALGSVNHLRIYEVLKAVENLREWKVELEELKAMLHLQGQYPQYSHFRDRVLESSQKALKEDTDISFTFNEVRGARKKVTHLVFKVKVQKVETIEAPKAPPYPPELETELKARGVQHLKRLADEGLAEEHWRKALTTDLREGALVVEARKHRDQVTGEQAKAKAKESQANRMKRNREWFLEHGPKSWTENGITVFPAKGGGINYAREDFMEEVKKRG